MFAGLMRGEQAPNQCFENRVVTRVDGERLIAWQNRLLRDEAGAIVGVLSSAEDITDRRRAEDELKRSEENYRTLVDSMQEGLGVQDQHGLITFANARLCEMVGYDVEELIGRPMSSLFDDDNRTVFERHMARRRPGERQSFEIAWRRRDGGAIATISAPSPRSDESMNLLGCVVVVTDLTARKVAEQALRESDRKLGALISNMPGFVYRCLNDKDWPTEFVSDGIYDLTGYAAREFLARDVAFGRLIHPDDVESVWSLIQAALDERRSFELEYRVLNRDGVFKWAWERGVGVYGPDGSVVALEGVVRDVTRQKESEDALRRSEYRLRSILETEPECVKIVSPAGDLVEMNPAGLAMLEAETLDQVRSRPFAEFVVPEHRPAFGRLHRRVMEGGEEHLEFEAIGLKGARKWLDTRVVPLRDITGAVVGVLGVTRDVTDRKKAEVALREGEERLRLALDAAQMGTFDWDIPRNAIAWSRWHEKLWGFAPGEFDGTYDALQSRIHPDERPGIAQEVARCVAARARFAREFRVVWPDRSVHWIAVTGEFGFDPSGAPLRVRGVAVETTERRLRDDLLSEAAARLRALSGRLLDAQESTRRAVARELHDEIGQALTAAKITLQALERFPDPGTLADRLRGATHVVDRALNQVRSLSLELRPPLLDDLGLVPALRWLIDQAAQPAGLVVGFVSEGFAARLALAVETVCFRVAQEALNNVVKHSGARSVLLSVQVVQATLHLRVRDNGVGFDPVAARRRALRGGSLGLLSMEERATLAGGGIEWISAPERGTDVHAWFPLDFGASEDTETAP